MLSALMFRDLSRYFITAFKGPFDPPCPSRSHLPLRFVNAAGGGNSKRDRAAAQLKLPSRSHVTETKDGETIAVHYPMSGSLRKKRAIGHCGRRTQNRVFTFSVAKTYERVIGIFPGGLHFTFQYQVEVISFMLAYQC